MIFHYSMKRTWPSGPQKSVVHTFTGGLREKRQGSVTYEGCSECNAPHFFSHSRIKIAHVKCAVEGHVACIWEKCSCFCASNSQEYKLMYCDWSFYCKYSWELVRPSCYQCCAIHVNVEWCSHALEFNGLLCPSPTNMQILWGKDTGQAI